MSGHARSATAAPRTRRSQGASVARAGEASEPLLAGRWPSQLLDPFGVTAMVARLDM
jgi:hypothetical protein